MGTRRFGGFSILKDWSWRDLECHYNFEGNEKKVLATYHISCSKEDIKRALI
ncbi:hypothetical protein [Spongiimicrobium sp. 3-5]|uniref:hypothetical protein n=1 Tax=Spongiimicrobium sp. 3-5 TaxID=3332596 RepID=UPI00397F8390